MKVVTDLAPDEIELISGLLNKEIVLNRLLSQLEHKTGKISQAELDWRLKHADYIESIYVKLFGFKP